MGAGQPAQQPSRCSSEIRYRKVVGLWGATDQPKLISILEEKYGVDFRASTNRTGNAQRSADWTMVTGNYDFGQAYLDQFKTQQYVEVMVVFEWGLGALGGLGGGACGGPGVASWEDLNSGCSFMDGSFGTGF